MGQGGQKTEQGMAMLREESQSVIRGVEVTSHPAPREKKKKKNPPITGNHSCKKKVTEELR